MLPNDPLVRVLTVDLSKKEFRIQERPDLFTHCLGGSGVAARLLLEECPPGCEPFAAANPIIFAVGPLTSLFPMASKTVAMFKSPLTGNLGESHCGGRTAMAIRHAGYGAIIITGSSSQPVYLVISENKVLFRDASTLWGMSSAFTPARVMREREDGAGLRTIMRIGRAGEAMVSYAGVTCETYRHFGRLGLGAIFGSKKLKGLVIHGTRTLPVADPKIYRQTYDEVFNAAVNSPLMKKYHELGTAENIIPLNKLKGIPTRNLQQNEFEKAETISGEYLAQNLLGRRLACAHCPVACIHIAAFRQPYENDPFFYKTSMIGYDYEPLYSLGSMLGIGDAPSVMRLIDTAEQLGLDLMSSGVVLAWATEAMEKRLINQSQTAGLAFAFGQTEPYIQALNYIVSQPNDFYKLLALGVEKAAAVYGGSEFAMAFAGNEMPGYHTGPAGYAGYLIGARHSHLDNAGYSLDQKELIHAKLEPHVVAEKLVAEEEWRQILSSLVICFFARGLYTGDVIRRTLACAGFSLEDADLARLGKEILQCKYQFKLREGFTFEQLRVPQRVFETASPTGMIDPEYLQAIIRHAQTLLQKKT